MWRRRNESDILAESLFFHSRLAPFLLDSLLIRAVENGKTVSPLLYHLSFARSLTLLSVSPYFQSASPAPPPPNHGWTKHVSPDGRPFWSKNGQSVWEKPSELKTPAEKEMESTPWKEYETGGRKYWVHDKTKETTWNPPKEIAGE